MSGFSFCKERVFFIVCWEFGVESFREFSVIFIFVIVIVYVFIVLNLFFLFVSFREKGFLWGE